MEFKQLLRVESSNFPANVVDYDLV
ncbi:hypothetical protein JL09_g5712 [Pichia kudriavzevii]|uniref:Uncharacterized protein n=2 Tax=Pichia kudriavzevii TaxID=4909 RepID=A0A099NQS6_PICKU|nr:hypothetical protein JL09_g5712 [Pichia kudriavzevii]